MKRKIMVELQKIVCLGAVEVEAENEKEAKEKAFMLFNKYDRDDYDMIRCYCPECESSLDDCDCEEEQEDQNEK